MNKRNIYDIAAQLDRLCPSQVDTATSGNGQQEAGHNGHEHHDRWPNVSWYCAGGNVGNPVLSIHPDDLDAAYDRLAAMPDGTLDRDIKPAFSGLRVEWHV